MGKREERVLRVDREAQLYPFTGCSGDAKSLLNVITVRSYVETVTMATALLIVLCVFDFDLYLSEVEVAVIFVFLCVYASYAELRKLR